MPYEHQPFPSVRYHRSGATKLVGTQEESDALKEDADWSDTPATFADAPHAEPKHPAAEQPDYSKGARAKSFAPRKKE